MNWFKWLFTSKYKKLLKHLDTQYKNKGGLWIYANEHVFRFDFEAMTIEVESIEEEINK